MSDLLTLGDKSGGPGSRDYFYSRLYTSLYFYVRDNPLSALKYVNDAIKGDYYERSGDYMVSVANELKRVLTAASIN